MNRTNVQRTIDVLRAPLPVGFDMCMWVEDHHAERTYGKLNSLPEAFNCGTTACLAGHIAIAFRDEIDLTDDPMISDAAQRFLGLNPMQAVHLFYGHFRDLEKTPHLRDVTVAETIKELERMLKDA